jgi:hypothetical protein
MNTVLIADMIVTAIYNLALLSGTAYLVLERGWNPWWFALTLCLIGTWTVGNKKEDKNV